MTPAVIAAAAVAAAAVSWPGPPDPARRLQRLFRSAAAAPAAGRPATAVRRPLLLLALVSVPAGLVAGVPWWVLLTGGIALAATARRATRRPPAAQLPLVLDLVASCLAAGASVPAALTAASAAAGTGFRSRLGTVAAALRDGADPAEAWRDLIEDPALGPLARCLARSGCSGAAVAAETTRLAARARSRRRAEVQQRAAKTSIWIVLPLGLCFLPAFVLVGVVPLALGLLRHVL